MVSRGARLARVGEGFAVCAAAGDGAVAGGAGVAGAAAALAAGAEAWGGGAAVAGDWGAAAAAAAARGVREKEWIWPSGLEMLHYGAG